MATETLLFEVGMDSKEEMRAMVIEVIQFFMSEQFDKQTILEFWRSLVRSKNELDEYRLSGPIQVPMYFSHIKSLKEFGELPCKCFTLNKDDIDATNTPDPSQLSWYSGKMIMRITPPGVWELTEEILDLRDPPMQCRVSMSLSDPKFKEVVKQSFIKQGFGDDLTIRQFKGNITTPSDLQRFVDQLSFFNAAFHHPISSVGTERIWFDLIQGRKSRNWFSLKTPFLLRIVSRRFDMKQLPTDGALIMSDVFFQSRRTPNDHDPDKCVGLYSSVVSLMLRRTGDELFPPVNIELWPDIQQPLLSLTPPGCHVDIFYDQIAFVSTTSVSEVWSMRDPQKAESGKAAQDWWKRVHDYMQKVLNAPLQWDSDT